MNYYKELSLIPVLNENEQIAQLHNSQRLLEETQYIDKCIAFFSDLMSRNSEVDVHTWSHTVLSHLVQQVGAFQGCLYRLSPAENEMELVASVAKSIKPKSTIAIGEGIIGEAVLSKQIFYTDKLDQFDVKASSGSLEFTPRALMVLPLMLNRRVEAVMELVTMFPFEKRNIQFINRLSTQLAAHYLNQRNREVVSRLLQEAQEANSSLVAQEEELRQNLEELQATQDALQQKSLEMNNQWDALNKSLAIITLTIDRRVTYANPIFLKLMGFELETLLEQPYNRFLVPDEPEVLADYNWLWEQMRAGQSVNKEFKRKNAKGETVWVLGSYNPMRDRDGNITQVLKFVIDITEQKRQRIEIETSQSKITALLNDAQENNMKLLAQEEELRQNLEELQATQEDLQRTSREMTNQWEAINQSLAIITFTPDARVIYANRIFLKVMGTGLDEIQGRSYKEYFVPNDEETQKEYDWLWDQMAAGIRVNKEFKRNNIKGETIWVYASYNPMVDKDGKVTQILKFVVDVTEQKRQRMEIEASQRQIQELLNHAQDSNLQLAAQEEELRQNFEELQATQEELQRTSRNMQNQWEAINQSLAIITLTPDARVIYANSNFLDVMKISLSAIQGRAYKDYFVPNEPEVMADYDLLWEKMAKGEKVNKEFKRKNARGETVWVIGSYNPMIDSDGKVTEILKFVIDVSEAKNQRIEIEQSKLQIQELFQEAQHANMQLTAQEEELRQNLEELQATQEELQRTTLTMKNQWAAINESLAIITLTPDEKVIYANRNFLKVMGTTLEDIQGKPYKNFFVPNEPDVMADYDWLWKQMRAGLNVNKEFKRQSANGETVWVYGSYNPMLNSKGEVTEILKFVVDLSEQKKQRLELEKTFEVLKEKDEMMHQSFKRIEQINSELKESELQIKQSKAQLSEALRLGGMGSWQIDNIDNVPVIQISPEHAQLLGLADQIHALPLEKYGIQFVAEEYRTAFVALMDSITRFKGMQHSEQLEYQMQQSDGSTRYCRIIARSINLHAAEQRVYGTIQDIHESKIREREIQELNDNLEQMVAERTKDLQSAIGDLQMAQNRLLQTEKMAALGQLVAGVAHEVNTPIGAIKSSVRNMLRILPSVVTDVPKMLTELDDELAVCFSAMINQSMTNSNSYTSVERRKLQQTIEQLLHDHEIEGAEIIAGNMVDIRVVENIESFIPLFESEDATRILDTAYKLGQLKVNMDNINLAAEKTAKIVFSLKSYSHIQQTDNFVETSLVDNIENILTLFSNQLKHGVELIRQFDINPTMPLLPDEIGQVWTNIIQNALHAMNNEGKLTIAIEQIGNEIAVRIGDNGPGIPADILPRIFEPFFTSKPKGQGTGLGLDISRRIIEKHNGRVDVQSEPGKTVFNVFLPLTQPQALEPAAATAQPVSTTAS
jgi:PAS domain S-box-containing protein